MKTLLLLSMLLLVGCGTEREAKNIFNKSPEIYSAYKIGQEYILNQPLDILEYDMLQIPLVNPGVQLVPAFTKEELNDPEMDKRKIKITGHLAENDRIRVIDFKFDGGWVPCHGNWLLPNPIIKVSTGSSAGRVLGISLISLDENSKNVGIELDKMPYTMKYIKPNLELIKLVDK
jgi:hypothetical protein